MTAAAVGIARLWSVGRGPGLALGGAGGGGRAARGLVTIEQRGALAELRKTSTSCPTMIALRGWDKRLPADASIRLDVEPGPQLWVAYMLAGQPLCSQQPLLDTSYPHVPVSRKADYVVVQRPLDSGRRCRRPAADGRTRPTALPHEPARAGPRPLLAGDGADGHLDRRDQPPAPSMASRRRRATSGNA